MEQKTDLGLGWAIISITNLNPIKFSQSFPAAVGRTRLDGRYQKIQCEPRNLFAPRVIVVLDVSDVESNIFNGTILYIL